MNNELGKIKHYLTAWTSSQKNEMHALFDEEEQFFGIREPKNEQSENLEDELFSTVHRHISEGDLLIALDYLRRNEREISSYAAMLNKLRTSEETAKETQTNFSKLGGIAKADPTQKEKNIVYEWWLDWQKNPKKYKSNAAFARDMIKDLDHIEDVRTITEKWCPEWEKLHSAG